MMDKIDLWMNDGRTPVNFGDPYKDCCLSDASFDFRIIQKSWTGTVANRRAGINFTERINA